MRRITGWFEQLTIEEDGEIQQRQDNGLDPVTPPRRAKLRERYEEISPTDTTFSGGSIFDVPERYHKPGSPCPRARFRDDTSEATSYDYSEEDDPDLQVKSSTETQLAPPNFPSAGLRSSSRDCYDPPSDRDFDKPLAPAFTSTTPPHDINTPRLVHLVSCLQCTLATLPCSRTTPSCTRCKRNGDPTTCLLRRRRFHEEIDESNASSCTLPVLLKLKNEDEGAWQKKMDVAAGLDREWQDRQHKKNWVLPKLDIERRGDWRVRWCLGRNIHPGEGWGRVAYEELVVEVEVEEESLF